MKIFVFSDNIHIFKPIYKIMKNLEISYFCSPMSKNKFKDFSFIKAKNIKSDYLELLDYDIGFSIHSNQIFPKKLVENVLCINLHPGYNPYNCGIFPQVFSIINKLKIGATLHIMNSKIDNGDIIDREEIEIKQYDTSLSLYNKIKNTEIKIFKRNLNAILNKKFNTTKINYKDNNYNSIKDFKNLCKIDLNKTLTMQEAIDYLRALSHKPYKNAYFLDKNGNKIYLRLEIEYTKIGDILTGGGTRQKYIVLILYIIYIKYYVINKQTPYQNNIKYIFTIIYYLINKKFLTK